MPTNKSTIVRTWMIRTSFALGGVRTFAAPPGAEEAAEVYARAIATARRRRAARRYGSGRA